MNKVEKVKILSELYELIDYYYDYRDQPVEPDFHFYDKVEKCCAQLELDFEEVLNEFKISTHYSAK